MLTRRSIENFNFRVPITLDEVESTMESYLLAYGLGKC